jgi:AAA15 family ATPase/GTPase
MQKLIVENFGPIKHAEIELRDFVVLIGEQASGKSTLAKLVYFFNSLSEDFISTASNADTNDLTKILNQLSATTSQKFVRYFGHPGFLPEFKIQFYFSSDLDKWVRLDLVKKTPNNSVIQTTYSQSFIGTYNREFDLLVKKFQSTSPDAIKVNDSDSEEVKRQKVVLQKLMVKEAGLNIYSLKPDSIYFPASRNISVQFSDLFKQTFYGAVVSKLGNGSQNLFNMSDSILMTEFLNHVATLKDNISAYHTFETAVESFKKAGTNLNEKALEVFIKDYQKILRGKYSISGNGERIYFDESPNNPIPIEQASSGQQESLRILQDIFSILINHLTAFRVIEEPEAHLFPTAQKYLIELFSLVVNETPSQVFITTHSPYVLSILSNLLYAKKVCDLGTATADEIEEKTGMNRKTWLDKSQFAAYTMDSDGISKSIFDRENTGLIDQNYLDQVSEDLGREFQVLHNLRLKQIRELNRKND